jgi:putative transcriptional regulator
MIKEDQMTKTNFDRIMAGMEDAIAIAEGKAAPGSYRVHVPASVDVRAIRKNMHLTQAEFALAFGFSTGAVRDWEQGRSNPEPTARVLLKVIEKRPDAVREALAAV